MAGNMHVHHSRRLPHQMVVKRGFLCTALLKFLHYRLDLILSENQVAHHHCGSAISFECCPRSKCESWLDVDALERDMQVFSRHTELDYVTGLHLSGTTHRLLYLLPIARSILWRGCCVGLAGGERTQEKRYPDDDTR